MAVLLDPATTGPGPGPCALWPRLNKPMYYTPCGLFAMATATGTCLCGAVKLTVTGGVVPVVTWTADV